MTDKIVRDEVLRSHRYVTLSSDTVKLLFFHMLLTSDHLSNCEATTTALSLAMGRIIDAEASAQLLSELADKDLVRLYEVDGKRYAHIPRSRQRIRYLNGKHPRPPSNIEDNEIKELISKVGLQSDHSPSTVRRSEEKRREEKKIKPSRVPRSNSKTPYPEDFDVTVEMIEQAVRIGVPRDAVVTESRQWRDHHKAKGSLFADWVASWRTWMRNSVKFAQQR